LLSVVSLGKQLDASSNGLGSEGGKAIAASIAENSTLTSVSPLFSLFFSFFSRK